MKRAGFFCIIILLGNNTPCASFHHTALPIIQIEDKYQHAFANTGNSLVSQSAFKQAFNEISEMLDGKRIISFKKAVWLTENAYYDGQLNWPDFNNTIRTIRNKLDQIIARKNLSQYKTSGNYAIFTFMTDSLPENSNIPYTYDLDNFMGDNDYSAFMVSHLLETKKGNCHSLPYLYKILATEMGVEAFIATAPMHIYIKHRDEQGKWWNLELTSGTFSRTSFIIESFNVTDEGIQSGLYMKALSEKESLCLCLLDLLEYYRKKGHGISDGFTRQVYEKGLQYYPNSLLLCYKLDDLNARMQKKLKIKGFNTLQEGLKDPEISALNKKILAVKGKLKEIGLAHLSEETYKAKVKEINDLKTKK